MANDSDEREERLQRLSPLARTAICAACSDRVIQIYKDHWIGDYWAEPAEALELAWSYAGGASVPGERLALLKDRLTDLVKYLAEEGVNILTSSVQVPRRALESIDPDVEASALAVDRALDSALWCAQIAESILHRSKAGPALAEAEEEAWQERAIDIAERSKGPLSRKDFEAAGPTPPDWWKAYQAGERHL
jgi:hypothetical protein